MSPTSPRNSEHARKGELSCRKLQELARLAIVATPSPRLYQKHERGAQLCVSLEEFLEKLLGIPRNS